MDAQQLLPPYAISLHHASRLKLYSESDRDVAKDLVEQVAVGDSEFQVEALKEVRDNASRFEVRVQWLGPDEAESSWQPATAMYDDAPVLFRMWAKANAKLQLMPRLVAEMEQAMGHPL
ncbi:hypothetical protein H310_05156 [Aphanomyces invadans]|uniref:Chromo domain-containing protein n=1 Tax=Aphanomyces invadans TaxID=157072 RepID=A0A024UC55_9STRA|nr:hypothetical protein H310_05156 [Aphanomyces invadans]ETW03790.1 hypothetical protein H310_05156 [Aphanomyces invadans]|eukprot:XP_008868019.1 hypothetical protein H310_05156 [Aphanomyces invadans]